MEEKVVKPITNAEVTPAEPVVEKQPVVEVKDSPSPKEELVDKTEESDAPESDVDVAKLIPQDHYRTSPLFYEVAQYFNIEDTDYDAAAPKLSVIVEWAITELKSNKAEDILLKLKDAEGQLSPPTWGEKRYTNLYRYIRLLSRRSAVDKAIHAYERRSI